MSAAPAKAAPAPARPKMKFKVIAGQYVHGKYTDSLGIVRQRVYNVGDVVESEINLASRWHEKFVAVDGETAPTPPSPANQVQAAGPVTPQAAANAENLMRDLNLDKMSVKELTDFAAAEEIDLKGSRDKAEILKIIKASFAG